MTTVHEFNVKNIKGQDVALSAYKGKVLLIVNVASKCGFTPQYTGLEGLQKEFGAKGFAVLGFPCNQFGGQEPGTEQDIEQFCTLNFGVSFPMFEKIDVNGADAHPMFDFLKKSVPGILGTEAIKWNFTKFLVDQSGKVVKRYAPQTKPEDIAGDISGLLGKGS